MNDLERSDNGVDLLFIKAKETATKIFSDLYISNQLDTDQFEKEIALLEKCKTIENIKELMSNIGIDDKLLESNSYSDVPTIGKITTIGSHKIIDNERLIAKTLVLEIAHAKVILDYSKINLPEGKYEINLDSRHSKCEILLPECYEIDNNFNEHFSKIKDKRKGNHKQVKVTIKLSGILWHSNIIIRSIKKWK